MNPASDPRAQGHHIHNVLHHRYHKDDGKCIMSSPRRVDGLRCVDVMREVEEQLAILSGGRDRRGGPVVTFPQSAKRERAKPEDYRRLLEYLLGVPCDDVRELGFSVVLDMRGNSSWSTVKPILKVLQEHFGNQVHTAHIIKPDNFWQKQRTSLASQKYKFETNLTSLESLGKCIDVSQLTPDLEGTLTYDNTVWIEMRCNLEDFLWQSSDLLDRLEDMREDLNHNDFADDVGGAKKGMEVHNDVKKQIHKLPVENIDALGQRLLQRLSSCESGNSYDSGYSGRDSTASNMTLNPDLQSSIPQIMQLLDQVHTGQQQLLQLWQVKKAKLDQCLQLRMFEQDCEKMFDWIYSNRDVFLANYVEIGQNHIAAKQAQEEHNQFTLGSNNVFVNIKRILSAAGQLIENSHYAAGHVRGVATRLDTAWKNFASGLDERTTVLALSVMFHQKAESYIENVASWSSSCEIQAVSSDIPVLEAGIHHHQTLYEGMCQAYTEVHSTSKKLLYQLDHLVQTTNAASVAESPQKKHRETCVHKKKDARVPPKSADPAADYQEGASHVLSVIHEILAHHRALESKWHTKKIKLHQRLALRLFQEDVKQVLDWLEKHGEVFLRKNVGIGRNLQKARAYQKSHETFEGVVQNTYTNAEKLLAAAEELAQTGECNAEDIYSVAHELESHISSFAQRVEQRRRVLELAVLFYSHVDELGNWFTELKAELVSEEVSESYEGAERLVEQFSTQRDSTLDACASTIAEGQSLLEELNTCGVSEMDSTGSVAAVQTTLEKLGAEREELGELWSTRKLRLDLCLQLRIFERDALELSSQFELWGEQLQAQDFSRELKEAEQLVKNLDQHLGHIQAATFTVAQRGQDLLQLFESSGISLMADSQYNGETRVQVLLEYIQERAIDMEDLSTIRRRKLEQCVQLCQFQNDATQVMRWIQNTEAMLMASFTIPGCLQEAEQLKKEHEQFQVAIEKTHSSAVHVRQRAETLLSTNHYDPASVKEVADSVTNRWQNLVTRAEERHKLVTASLNFYKTAEQVCSVLDSLEREYKREDDWLSRHTSGDHDRATLIAQLINKHQEQKEAFLKACTLARRTAETFLKYSNRSLQYFSHPNESSFRGPETKVKIILEKLLTQENRVLEYWTSKKKRLDQNQQFVLFERSAKQSLAWIKEEGDIYLSTHTNVGDTKEETEQLLMEHNSFKETARETREKVKLLLQLADTLVEKGHAHAPNIKQWVEEVDDTYKNFSTRMDQYRSKLENSLGVSSVGDLSLDSSRNSDPNLEARLGDGDLKQMTKLNEEKRKSARRKEFIMAELLETERSYVKDIELAVNFFLKPMRDSQEVPPALKGKDNVIFGNLEEICNFHKSVFLKELEKYETMPEDVGHCFVTWAQKFDVYVTYCTNKPKSSELLVKSGGSFFEKLQKIAGIEQPLAAYLIKPVQRITKYQLLLKDLLNCSHNEGEIKEGLEVCLSVPRKANDALHLSMLEGCDINVEQLGEVILQDCFQVWDPKKLIRQSRDRRMFLFDLYVIFSKEVKDSNGKAKYVYKMKMMTSDIGITEHIEGDECKFALWAGKNSISESKVILKASTIDVKLHWVKKMRQLIQDTYFGNSNVPASLPSLQVPRDHKTSASQRSSRDFDDAGSLDESIENMERGSLASFGSGGTTDSETTQRAICGEMTWVVRDHDGGSSQGEISVKMGNQVEVLELPSSHPDYALVRLSMGSTLSEVTRPDLQEGLVPLSCLKPNPGGGKAFPSKAPSDPDQDGSCDGGGGGVSPVNKRRVFSGKWLPNIRKLSQGKLEKSQSIGGHDARHLHKQISKNKFKFGQPSIDVGMGNKPGHSQSESEDSEPARLPPSGRGMRQGEGQEEGEEPDVELPPPMRPISSLPSQEEPSSSKPEVADWNGSLLTEGTIDLDSRLLDTAGCETDKEALRDTVDEQVDESDPALKAIAQRQYRLNELLESERMYVSDLEECYCYVKFMRDSKNSEDAQIQMPEDLKEGKDRMVFGNLENIYEWHRDFFLKNLEKCIENPVELGNLFKRYERKFQMYVVYCQNKPKSEYIVSEHIDTYFEEIRLKLGFKLRLTDLLIKPIQRLTKYHMLLEAILKHSERANLEEEATAIGHAFHVMTVVPKSANDMMDIGRLQGFEGKIVAQGNLLLRGPLQCTDDPSTGPNFKLKEMTVFLFEQIMIFAETVGKKTQFTSPVYTYKNHIQVNKMALEEKVEGGDPLMFKIKCTDPNRSHMTYICLAEDQSTRDRWRGCIRRQLQVQQDFLRALQDPVGYHNKIGKEFSASDLNQRWDVTTSLTPPIQRHNGNRPKSNPNDMLEHVNLSIEEVFDRAMSLPSSPVVKDAPDESFDSFDEAPKKERKYSDNKSKSGVITSSVARKTFLEGFRIRSRNKSSDDINQDRGVVGLASKLDKQPGTSGTAATQELLVTEDQSHSRRWSEITGPKQSEISSCGLISSGCSARVMIDYHAVREDELTAVKGDEVVVVTSNLSRGYLVHRAATSHRPAMEGWLPSYCLHLHGNNIRKPGAWAFRVRNPSFGKMDKVGQKKGEPGTEDVFAEHLNNLSVIVGENAHLSCRVVPGKEDTPVVWKGPTGEILKKSSKVEISHGEDGLSSLTILNCDLEDAGQYYCILTNQEGSHSSSARLAVSYIPAPPGQPKVQDLKGTSAVITWDRLDTAKSRLFSLQWCRLATGQWQTVRTDLADGLCIVDNLVQGETYSFRVMSHGPDLGPASQRSEPSLPSPPLTVPLTDLSATVAGVPPLLRRDTGVELPDPTWQPDFELQYIELEEVGRGRFAVVRRCQEILTGREVAVKFVNRRKQSREVTKREYELLGRIRHQHLVSASGLFVTANSDAIVMSLVSGPPLFDHLCTAPSYTEATVGRFMSQLVSGLQHLHAAKIIHLDLKPENLLLDTQSKQLKLVDFGDAQPLRSSGSMNMAGPSQDSGPEFMSPESISKGPVGTYTDMWGFGVILYVLLSGLSPFLDDSEEETTNNILRCDFSYPEEQCTVSNYAKDLIGRLLVVNPCQRLSAASCLTSLWSRHARTSTALLSSRHLANFVARRRKRINTLAPAPACGTFTRIPRPESLYKKLSS